MKRMTETTHVSVLTDEIEANAESDFEVHNEENLVIPDGVEVYEIDGPFFFGIANKFDDVMASMSDKPKVRIIRMRRIPFIDSTGIHNLRNLISMSHKEDIKIILSGVNDDVRKMLERNGFNELVGKRFICPNINVALEVASEEVNKK